MARRYSTVYTVHRIQTMYVQTNICTYVHDMYSETCSVLIIKGTYYQGWFMYMRYTQRQNEECLLSRSVY